MKQNKISAKILGILFQRNCEGSPVGISVEILADIYERIIYYTKSYGDTIHAPSTVDNLFFFQYFLRPFN